MNSDHVDINTGCSVDVTAQLRAHDLQGTSRPIKIGTGCRIGPNAIIYGGTILRDHVVVEEGVIVGKPEYGYAVGRMYAGQGGVTTVASGSILRAGACLYSGCSLGEDVAIGHNSVVRSDVSIGSHTQIAHMVSVERGCQLGSFVRCSPLTHLTSEVLAEDYVFFGACIATINDKGMIWRDPGGELPVLEPPVFRRSCRIGSGSVVLAGVEVGEESLVGSGSVVTRNVPRNVVVFGNPAKVVKERT